MTQMRNKDYLMFAKQTNTKILEVNSLSIYSSLAVLYSINTKGTFFKSLVQEALLKTTRKVDNR